jgi:DNA-binding NarL/FixJ family response regulator
VDRLATMAAASPPAAAPSGLDLLILESHGIYRRGLAASLAGVEDVATISEAGSVEEAMRGGLADADVILLDPDQPGGSEVLRRARELTRGRILVCSSTCDEQSVLSSIQYGAAGFLRKDTLTPEALAGAVRAAASGAGVITPELLGGLMRSLARLSRDVLEPRGLSLSRLTSRETEVLRLVAQGYPTREVAAELSWSERTVKNVLHDVVTKLNARSRSQAVALAVREGLI